MFRDKAIKSLELKLNLSSQHPVVSQSYSGECRKKTRVEESELAQSLLTVLKNEGPAGATSVKIKRINSRGSPSGLWADGV